MGRLMIMIWIRGKDQVSLRVLSGHWGESTNMCLVAASPMLVTRKTNPQNQVISPSGVGFFIEGESSEIG